MQIKIEEEPGEHPGQEKVMTGDRNVQGCSIVIHVVHKRDKKCSDA
jgi:hypothetical protein